MSAKLDELISQLPELYQPIYGHDAGDSSRTLDAPRVAQILSVVDALHRRLGRPLRVLDLGSAQGLFAMLIAEGGHHVTGVDYLPINVAVAQAVAEEHPHLDVAFVSGDLLDIDAVLAADSFDLVLGLSVLHHVLHRDGPDRTQQIVDLLHARVPHALFEMALCEEPLYWAESLPADPRFTISAYEFVREVGRSGTHLSSVERPLLFCSSTLALIDGEMHHIDRFRTTSHAMADLSETSDRRYFELDSGIVVKIVARFADDADTTSVGTFQEELRSEMSMLDQLTGAPIATPSVVEFVDLPTEVLLARSMLAGTIVSETPDLLDADLQAVFTGVVDQLATYEHLGLFHTDLRTWNVLWNAADRRINLIDYGALSPARTDVVWPFDPLHSFVIFAISLWTRTSEPDGLVAPRTIDYEPTALPSRVRHLVESILDAPVPPSFDDIRTIWSTVSAAASTNTTEPPSSETVERGWMRQYGRLIASGHPGLRNQITELLAANDALEDEHRRALVAHAQLDVVHAAALESYGSIQHELQLTQQAFADVEAELQRTLLAYHDVEAELQHAVQSYHAAEAQRLDASREAARAEALFQVARAELIERTEALVEARALLDGVRHEAQQQSAAAYAVAAQATNRSHELDQLVNALTHTVSWRITRPLRGVRRLVPRRRSAKS